jgi:hypothetical protein
VDHADPVCERVVGGSELNLLPAKEERTFVRLYQAEKDVHEGGLAGSVLPQDGMDLALLDLHVNVIKGQYSRETLREGAGRKDGICRRYVSVQRLRQIGTSRIGRGSC